MSLPTTDSPEPQPTEDALDFLLPGTLPVVPDLLDSFVSSQSLTGHAVLEGVDPFNGVYNIDGLFFIKLDGRVFEVEFDSDNFRYNIVLRDAPGADDATTQPEEGNHEEILRDWHPYYRAERQGWVLLHTSVYPDAGASSQTDQARLTTLPYRVDGLLRPEDLVTVVNTVETFLLQRSTAKPETPDLSKTLLSLLASPHLTTLTASPGNAGLSRKTLSDTLDAMLKSAPADELATQLLSALAWYGGKDGETTDPAIRQQLVWAALMLELDPPGLQRSGHVAGCDLEGPDNWGLTYSERRARLMTTLTSTTYTPEMALHILGPAIPEFMVEHMDNDLRYGSAPWVNFAHGVALANVLQPESSLSLTFDELIELPLRLSQGATEQELRLIAVTRALPCVIWARAHGVLQGNAAGGWSLRHLDIAAKTLDDHLMLATRAVEDVTRQAPNRSDIAYEKLQEIFGVNYAQFLQYKNMHGASLWKQLLITLKNPSPQESNGTFFLIDVFAAGQMINGLDQYQPLASLADQEDANQAFSINANKLKGIDIPAMFEAAFDHYEARATSAYAFLIENLLSRLPLADRRALQQGRVCIHTLRTWTGKLEGQEHEQDRLRKRGRFGFIIECQHLGSSCFYEIFPILGLFVRHAKLSIPTTRAADYPAILPSALKLSTGTQVAIDWNAYETLAAPQAGKRSRVISERILDFAAPGTPGDDGPVPLTSIRFKHIAFAVANKHAFFNPHDSRAYHRQRTASEVVDATYPMVLRALESIVPGLACVNATATDEGPGVTCTLEAATYFLAPVFKFLRGTVRLMASPGRLVVLGGLPKFATLTPSALLSTASRYKQGLVTDGMATSAGALIGQTLRVEVLKVDSIHALMTRMKGYVNTVAGRTGRYSLISSVPSVPAPGTWRPLSAVDALGRVNGIKQVPVRSIPDSSSGTSGSHYLITPDTAQPFGPRLISKTWFNPPQRINNQLGYSLSGRGAMASPIASPNSGIMGEAIEATADIGAVLKTHGITANDSQLETIGMWLKEGAPVFLYETSTGRKSLVLHVADEKIYQDLLTDAKVYFFRHYNHQTLGTWKVPSEMQGQIRQVKPDELLAGRSNLSSDRLASVREAIIEGQLLPPIKVRPPSHGRYSVVDGNHRLEVARNLGLENVPVQIVPM